MRTGQIARPDRSGVLTLELGENLERLGEFFRGSGQRWPL